MTEYIRRDVLEHALAHALDAACESPDDIADRLAAIADAARIREESLAVRESTYTKTVVERDEARRLARMRKREIDRLRSWNREKSLEIDRYRAVVEAAYERAVKGAAAAAAGVLSEYLDGEGET